MSLNHRGGRMCRFLRFLFLGASSATFFSLHPLLPDVRGAVVEPASPSGPTTETNEPILANLSFDALSKIQVKIASVAERSVREQPAIVSVISDKEIHATGAKDLADILELVPGFSFGEDVDGAMGMGFRGLWAYEGKVLVLVDGVPVNEGLYGTVLLGNHYSADQIKQVEIVRGPGSARYGGNAELAVISITTKGAEQNGGFASVRPEIVSDRVGTHLDGSVGYTLKDDWRLSLGINYYNFVRSDQPYVAEDGDVVGMKNRSGMDPYTINAALGWKDLDLRVIYDNYTFDNPASFGDPSLEAPGTLWTEKFQSLLTSAKYDLKPADWLTISPMFTYTQQHPWWLTTSPGQGNFELEYDKYNLDVPDVFEINEDNHLLLGVTGYYESAQAIQTSPFFGQPPPATFFDGADSVDYRDVAGYGQYDLDTRWGSVSLGGRYENHTYVGSAFVPRVALVKAWDKFHVKLLYDQAFRTPNVEIVQQRLAGANITDEKTSSYQLEAGYQFNSHVSTVANLYYMRIKKPLAFTTVDNTVFGYTNGSPVSTYGGELELRYQNDIVSGYLGYSYYQADEQLGGDVGLYGSSVGGQNLALPQHKVSFSGTWHVCQDFDWNVSGAYMTSQQAWAYPGTEQSLSPECDLDTYLEYRWRHMSFGLGIRNLLNEYLEAGQAYNGGNAPLPLLRRNYFLTVAYNF